MQYQISYYSPNGHAETLVNAFCQLLPIDTYVSNLEEEEQPIGNIQLVGFDFAGTNLNAIPLKVMEYLDMLEGKTVFLFATVPFQPNDTVERHIHNNVLAFLPRDCDFRGLFLCGAQPSDVLIRDLNAIISHNPENTRAKHWLERCERATGHPDRIDIQNACSVLKNVLELGEV